MSSPGAQVGVSTAPIILEGTAAIPFTPIPVRAVPPPLPLPPVPSNIIGGIPPPQSAGSLRDAQYQIALMEEARQANPNIPEFIKGLRIPSLTGLSSSQLASMSDKQFNEYVKSLEPKPVIDYDLASKMVQKYDKPSSLDVSDLPVNSLRRQVLESGLTYADRYQRALDEYNRLSPQDKQDRMGAQIVIEGLWKAADAEQFLKLPITKNMLLNMSDADFKQYMDMRNTELGKNLEMLYGSSGKSIGGGMKGVISSEQTGIPAGGQTLEHGAIGYESLNPAAQAVASVTGYTGPGMLPLGVGVSAEGNPILAGAHRQKPITIEGNQLALPPVKGVGEAAIQEITGDPFAGVTLPNETKDTIANIAKAVYGVANRTTVESVMGMPVKEGAASIKGQDDSGKASTVKVAFPEKEVVGLGKTATVTDYAKAQQPMTYDMLQQAQQLVAQNPPPEKTPMNEALAGALNTAGFRSAAMTFAGTAIANQIVNENLLADKLNPIFKDAINAVNQNKATADQIVLNKMYQDYVGNNDKVNWYSLGEALEKAGYKGASTVTLPKGDATFGIGSLPLDRSNLDDALLNNHLMNEYAKANNKIDGKEDETYETGRKALDAAVLRSIYNYTGFAKEGNKLKLVGRVFNTPVGDDPSIINAVAPGIAMNIMKSGGWAYVFRSPTDPLGRLVVLDTESKSLMNMGDFFERYPDLGIDTKVQAKFTPTLAMLPERIEKGDLIQSIKDRVDYLRKKDIITDKQVIDITKYVGDLPGYQGEVYNFANGQLVSVKLPSGQTLSAKNLQQMYPNMPQTISDAVSKSFGLSGSAIVQEQQARMALSPIISDIQAKAAEKGFKPTEWESTILSQYAKYSTGETNYLSLLGSLNVIIKKGDIKGAPSEPIQYNAPIKSSVMSPAQEEAYATQVESGGTVRLGAEGKPSQQLVNGKWVDIQPTTLPDMGKTVVGAPEIKVPPLMPRQDINTILSNLSKQPRSPSENATETGYQLSDIDFANRKLSHEKRENTVFKANKDYYGPFTDIVQIIADKVNNWRSLFKLFDNDTELRLSGIYNINPPEPREYKSDEYYDIRLNPQNVWRNAYAKYQVPVSMQKQIYDDRTYISFINNMPNEPDSPLFKVGGMAGSNEIIFPIDAWILGQDNSVTWGHELGHVWFDKLTPTEKQAWVNELKNQGIFNQAKDAVIDRYTKLGASPESITDDVVGNEAYAVLFSVGSGYGINVETDPKDWAKLAPFFPSNRMSPTNQLLYSMPSSIKYEGYTLYPNRDGKVDGYQKLFDLYSADNVTKPQGRLGVTYQPKFDKAMLYIDLGGIEGGKVIFIDSNGDEQRVEMGRSLAYDEAGNEIFNPKGGISFAVPKDIKEIKNIELIEFGGEKRNYISKEGMSFDFNRIAKEGPQTISKSYLTTDISTRLGKELEQAVLTESGGTVRYDSKEDKAYNVATGEELKPAPFTPQLTPEGKALHPELEIGGEKPTPAPVKPSELIHFDEKGYYKLSEDGKTRVPVDITKIEPQVITFTQPTGFGEPAGAEFYPSTVRVGKAEDVGGPKQAEGKEGAYFQGAGTVRFSPLDKRVVNVEYFVEKSPDGKFGTLWIKEEGGQWDSGDIVYDKLRNAVTKVVCTGKTCDLHEEDLKAGIEYLQKEGWKSTGTKEAFGKVLTPKEKSELEQAVSQESGGTVKYDSKINKAYQLIDGKWQEIKGALIDKVIVGGITKPIDTTGQFHFPWELGELNIPFIPEKAQAGEGITGKLVSKPPDVPGNSEQGLYFWGENNVQYYMPRKFGTDANDTDTLTNKFYFSKDGKTWKDLTYSWKGERADVYGDCTSEECGMHGAQINVALKFLKTGWPELNKDVTITKETIVMPKPIPVGQVGGVARNTELVPVSSEDDPNLGAYRDISGNYHNPFEGKGKITYDQVQQIIDNADPNQKFIVDLSGYDWCGGCREYMRPAIDKWLENNQDKGIQAFYISYDQNTGQNQHFATVFADKYGIPLESVPKVVLIQGGKVVISDIKSDDFQNPDIGGGLNYKLSKLDSKNVQPVLVPSSSFGNKPVTTALPPPPVATVVSTEKPIVYVGNIDIKYANGNADVIKITDVRLSYIDGKPVVQFNTNIPTTGFVLGCAGPQCGNWRGEENTTHHSIPIDLTAYSEKDLDEIHLTTIKAMDMSKDVDVAYEPTKNYSLDPRKLSIEQAKIAPSTSKTTTQTPEVKKAEETVDKVVQQRVDQYKQNNPQADNIDIFKDLKVFINTTINNIQKGIASIGNIKIEPSQTENVTLALQNKQDVVNKQIANVQSTVITPSNPNVVSITRRPDGSVVAKDTNNQFTVVKPDGTWAKFNSLADEARGSSYGVCTQDKCKVEDAQIAQSVIRDAGIKVGGKESVPLSGTPLPTVPATTPPSKEPPPVISGGTITLKSGETVSLSSYNALSKDDQIKLDKGGIQAVFDVSPDGYLLHKDAYAPQYMDAFRQGGKDALDAALSKDYVKGGDGSWMRKEIRTDIVEEGTGIQSKGQVVDGFDALSKPAQDVFISKGYSELLKEKDKALSILQGQGYGYMVKGKMVLDLPQIFRSGNDQLISYAKLLYPEDTISASLNPITGKQVTRMPSLNEVFTQSEYIKSAGMGKIEWGKVGDVFAYIGQSTVGSPSNQYNFTKMFFGTPAGGTHVERDSQIKWITDLQLSGKISDSDASSSIAKLNTPVPMNGTADDYWGTNVLQDLKQRGAIPEKEVNDRLSFIKSTNSDEANLGVVMRNAFRSIPAVDLTMKSYDPVVDKSIPSTGEWYFDASTEKYRPVPLGYYVSTKVDDKTNVTKSQLVQIPEGYINMAQPVGLKGLAGTPQLVKEKPAWYGEADYPIEALMINEQKMTEEVLQKLPPAVVPAFAFAKVAVDLGFKGIGLIPLMVVEGGVQVLKGIGVTIQKTGEEREASAVSTAAIPVGLAAGAVVWFLERPKAIGENPLMEIPYTAGMLGGHKVLKAVGYDIPKALGEGAYEISILTTPKLYEKLGLTPEVIRKQVYPSIGGETAVAGGAARANVLSVEPSIVLAKYDKSEMVGEVARQKMQLIQNVMKDIFGMGINTKIKPSGVKEEVYLDAEGTRLTPDKRNVDNWRIENKINGDVAENSQGLVQLSSPDGKDRVWIKADKARLLNATATSGLMMERFGGEITRGRDTYIADTSGGVAYRKPVFTQRIPSMHQMGTQLEGWKSNINESAEKGGFKAGAFIPINPVNQNAPFPALFLSDQMPQGFAQRGGGESFIGLTVLTSKNQREKVQMPTDVQELLTQDKRSEAIKLIKEKMDKGEFDPNTIYEVGKYMAATKFPELENYLMAESYKNLYPVPPDSIPKYMQDGEIKTAVWKFKSQVDIAYKPEFRPAEGNLQEGWYYKDRYIGKNQAEADSWYQKNVPNIEYRLRVGQPITWIFLMTKEAIEDGVKPPSYVQLQLMNLESFKTDLKQILSGAKRREADPYETVTSPNRYKLDAMKLYPGPMKWYDVESHVPTTGEFKGLEIIDRQRPNEPAERGAKSKVSGEKREVVSTTLFTSDRAVIVGHTSNVEPTNWFSNFGGKSEPKFGSSFEESALGELKEELNVDIPVRDVNYAGVYRGVRNNHAHEGNREYTVYLDKAPDWLPKPSKEMDVVAKIWFDADGKVSKVVKVERISPESAEVKVTEYKGLPIDWKFYPEFIDTLQGNAFRMKQLKPDANVPTNVDMSQFKIAKSSKEFGGDIRTLLSKRDTDYSKRIQEGRELTREKLTEIAQQRREAYNKLAQTMIPPKVQMLIMEIWKPDLNGNLPPLDYAIANAEKMVNQANVRAEAKVKEHGGDVDVETEKEIGKIKVEFKSSPVDAIQNRINTNRQRIDSLKSDISQQSNIEQMIRMVESELAGLRDAINKDKERLSKLESESKASNITKDAESLIASADVGGTPGFVSKNMERIARENGIEQSVIDKSTPNEIIDILRQKQSSATVSPDIASLRDNITKQQRKINDAQTVLNNQKASLQSLFAKNVEIIGLQKEINKDNASLNEIKKVQTQPSIETAPKEAPKTEVPQGVTIEDEALRDWYAALKDYGQGRRPDKIGSLYPEEASNRLNKLALASNNPILVAKAADAFTGKLSTAQYKAFIKDAIKELFNETASKELIRNYTQSYIVLKDKLAMGLRDELLPRYVDDAQLWGNADAMKEAGISVEKIKQATNGLMTDAEYANIMRKVLDINMDASEKATFGTDRINRMIQSAITDYRNYRDAVRGTQFGIPAGEQPLRVVMGKEGRPETIETGWPGRTFLYSWERQNLLIDKALQIPELAERAQRVRDGKTTPEERAAFLLEATKQTGLYPETDMMLYYNKRAGIIELFQGRINRLSDATTSILKNLGNKIEGQYQESALKEVVRLSGDLLEQAKYLANEAKMVGERKGYQVLDVSNKILDRVNLLYEAAARKSWPEVERQAQFLRDFFTGQRNKDYYTLRDLYDVTSDQLQKAKGASGWLTQQVGMNVAEQYNTVALKLEPTFNKMNDLAQTLKSSSGWLLDQASDELKAQYNTQRVQVDNALQSFRDVTQGIKNKIDSAKITGVWLSNQVATELEAQYNTQLLSVKNTIDALSDVSNKVKNYVEQKVGPIAQVGKWEGQQLSMEMRAQYNSALFIMTKITEQQIETAKNALDKINTQLRIAQTSGQWLRDRVSNELQAAYNRQVLNTQGIVDRLTRVVNGIDKQIQTAKLAGGWLSSQTEMELRAAYNHQILTAKNALSKLNDISSRIGDQVEKQFGYGKAATQFLGQQISMEMQAQYNAGLLGIEKITDVQIANAKKIIDQLNIQVQYAKSASDWLKDRASQELQVTYNQQLLNVTNAIDGLNKVVSQIDGQIKTAKLAGKWLTAQAEQELMARYNEQSLNLRNNVDKLVSVAQNIDAKVGQGIREVTLEMQRQYNVLLMNAEDALEPMLKAVQKLYGEGKASASWIGTEVSVEMQARYTSQLSDIQRVLEQLKKITDQINEKVSTAKVTGKWLADETAMELQARYNEQLFAFNEAIGKLTTTIDQIRTIGGDKVAQFTVNARENLNAWKDYSDGTLKNFKEYVEDIYTRQPLGATRLRKIVDADIVRYYEEGYRVDQELRAAKRIVQEQLKIDREAVQKMKGEVKPIKEAKEKAKADVTKETVDIIERYKEGEIGYRPSAERYEKGKVSFAKPETVTTKERVLSTMEGKVEESISRIEKPITEKLVTEKPMGEKAVAERAIPEKPIAERPTVERPVSERPVAERPVSEKQPSEKPPTGKYPPEKPVGYKPVIPPIMYKGSGITIKTKHGEKYLTPEQLQASIAWKQGFVYRLWYPRYGQEDMHVTRNPIPGVPYKEGLRSAYESARILFGGDIPDNIKRTMGVVNISAFRSPDRSKPTLHFDESYNKPKNQRHNHKQSSGTSLGSIR